MIGGKERTFNPPLFIDFPKCFLKNFITVPQISLFINEVKSRDLGFHCEREACYEVLKTYRMNAWQLCSFVEKEKYKHPLLYLDDPAFQESIVKITTFFCMNFMTKDSIEDRRFFNEEIKTFHRVLREFEDNLKLSYREFSDFEKDFVPTPPVDVG